MSKRVLMAMSGGIDSTVSAMLLQRQGFELVGVTFRTFDSIKESCLAREKGCCSVESIMEAKNMAKTLGFEHHILDYREIFKQTVIQNFVSEYMSGRTPNPCVLCNSHIKWGELIKAADELGCDFIATGHYAQIDEHRGHLYLKNAVDTKKDQTYFLWMLTEDNLRRTIFPLGGLTKEEVRRIAAEAGFEKLSKKTESQEICFVPDNDYRHFLQEQGCKCEKGVFVDKEGRVLGKNEGYQNYTIGQRKGLGIALGRPQFVCHIDAENNRVTLGERDDLLTNTVKIKDVKIRDIDWLYEDPTVKVRIRYRSPATDANLIFNKEEMSTSNFQPPTSNIQLPISNPQPPTPNLELPTVDCQFSVPVWGATPGQSAVIYKENLLVGGGTIIS